MGIGKEHTGSGQAIKIGSPRLGMSSQAPNPVIQIVECNEQDIGFRYRNTVPCECIPC